MENCHAKDDYGHECILNDRHGPIHLCDCGDEWYLDDQGETVWVTADSSTELASNSQH